MNAACGAAVMPNIRSICGVSSGHDPGEGTLQAPTAAVQGDITTGAIGDDERTLRMLVPRLKACANKGLQQDPTMSGNLVMAVTVMASGEVSDAHQSSGAGLSPAVASCMLAIARRAIFTQSPARRYLSITVRSFLAR